MGCFSHWLFHEWPVAFCVSGWRGPKLDGAITLEWRQTIINIRIIICRFICCLIRAQVGSGNCGDGSPSAREPPMCKPKFRLKQSKIKERGTTICGPLCLTNANSHNRSLNHRIWVSSKRTVNVTDRRALSRHLVLAAINNNYYRSWPCMPLHCNVLRLNVGYVRNQRALCGGLYMCWNVALSAFSVLSLKFGWNGRKGKYEIGLRSGLKTTKQACQLKQIGW